MDIKQLVTPRDKQATFSYLRHGIAYYTVNGENGTYQFNIELSDLGDATINASEKAISLMRYIRKSDKDGTLIKVA